MNKRLVENLTRCLCEALDGLIGVQDRLHEVMQTKLDAMRRCDVDGMIAAGRDEQRLASEASALDARRLEIVGQMLPPLGLARHAAARAISIRMLAARAPKPVADRLTATAKTLRERMLKVAEANRVVELVSREMLGHFRSMFSAMVQDDEEPQTYSPRGGADRAVGARVFDAVG